MRTQLLKLLIYCAALGTSLSPLVSRAQLAKEPLSIPSPNASTLGLFGQVPVSQFTGLPTVSIPLFEAQEGALRVPVSLNYHASGFRPEMHPGWVGVGWNLTAGGAITRVMHQYPDEMTWPGVPGRTASYTNIGFMYNFVDHNVNGANWEQNSAQLGLIDDDNNQTPGAGWHRDTEPDEFSFSFGGYSGKFYWTTTGNNSTTGKWRVQCNKPVKVTLLNPGSPLLTVPFKAPKGSLFSPEVCPAGYPKMLSGFIITTEDGTQYQFGGVTSAIEYQIPFFRQNDQIWQANSWYLTRITGTDGRLITLNYVTEPERIYISQMYFTYSAAAYDVSHPFDPFTPQPACSGVNGAPPGYGGQLIRPVYLSSVNWGSNSLSFASSYTTELPYPQRPYILPYNDWVQYWQHNNYSGYGFMPFLEGDVNDASASPYNLYDNSTVNAGAMANLKWRKLTGIKLYRSGQVIQSYALDYTDNRSQRLVLNQVTEETHDGTAVSRPPYVFTYNNSSIFSLAYLSDMSDHWGFYDARSSDVVQLLTNNNSFSALAGYYALREPSTDPSVYLSGVLTSMQYPTGGKTTFDYEQHTYGKQVTTDRSQVPTTLAGNTVAGGLRISKITSSSGDGAIPDLVKRYYYNENYSAANGATGRSSGILGGLVQYYAPHYSVQASTDGSVTYQEDLFSTQSTLPACNSGQGSHIGYSVVTEVLGDGSYTTTRFTNFDTGNVDDMPAPGSVLQVDRTPYLPYSSREHERGLLLSEKMYGRNGQLVRQKTVDYSALNKSLEFARAVQASYFNVCSNTAVSVYNGASWRYYTYPYLPVQENETVYDANGNNPLTTNKSIGYATSLATDYNSRLPSAESVTDSKGRSLYTIYTYPFDVTYPASLAAPTDPSASALLAMVGKNIIGYPVETQKFSIEALSTGYFRLALYDAEARTFKWGGVGNASVLPAQVYKFAAAQPIDPTTYSGMHYGTSSSSPVVLDNRLSAKVSFDSYDSQGNVLGITKEGQERSAYQWGYDGSLLVSKATNALPGEVLAETFEENKGQWDGNMAYESVTYNGSVYRNVPHTGKYAGRVRGGGQVHSFSKTLNITAGAGRYVFSAWVYSEGPTAQLWLFKNRPGDLNSDGSVNYYGALSGNNYLNYTETPVTGQWVYLEQEVDVPSDVTMLTLRLTSFDRNSTGKSAWFDDVRLHPAAAQVATYTHTPQVGVTSMSDANNKPTYYEYDGLNRLSLVRDQDGNVVKTYQYHYKNQ